MTWQEYLKTQGYSDAEITNMATTFGSDKMAKAFETPMRAQAEAEKALADAKHESEEFQAFYQNEVLPKVSTVYQDAINARTRAAALEARLSAAKEFGFLSDPKVVDGVVPGVGAIPPNPVPGSPGAPASTSTSTGTSTGDTIDSRYVSSQMFTEQVERIPDMLAALTDISNQHFALFGSPLPDIQDLVKQAKDSKGKINVRSAWEQKYKVPDKRAEIEKARQEAHDKEVADAAVRKYASEHNMPHLAPGRQSIAPAFSSRSTDEARQPWKGAKDRKAERRETFLHAMMPGSASASGTGTGSKVN